MTAPDVLALLDADAERAGKVEAQADSGPDFHDLDGGVVHLEVSEYVSRMQATAWLVERLRAHIDLARVLVDLRPGHAPLCGCGQCTMHRKFRAALASALGGGEQQ